MKICKHQSKLSCYQRDNGSHISNCQKMGDVLHEDPNGNQYYTKDIRLHREDGPAVILVDDPFIKEEWLLKGKLHRLDGPATIRKSGFYTWHIHNIIWSGQKLLKN